MVIIELGKASVVLKDWNILMIKSPSGGFSELFVGFSVGDGLGRVSTVIKNYDETSREGSTFSGSTYRLIGEPGLPHSDAIYVLEQTVGAEFVQRELFSKQGKGIAKFRYPID
jgi:hypothetical protein